MISRADKTLAIAGRVVRQIVKDRRSLGLILVAPVIVMSLVGFSLSDQQTVLNRVAPALLGVFAFFFTFVLTDVSFLRERAQGTLERLLTTPVGRADVLLGYLLGFMLFAAIQSLIILTFTVLVLRVDYRGDLVQFIPLVFAPQVFLSGVIVPVNQMPAAMEAISHVLPLTYAVEGLREIMLQGKGLDEVLVELGVLAGFGAVLLTAAAATVRRA